ncbi:thiol-disulfide oxidoreductase DCC family protein [Paenibacillus sedimenti]|uniref:Thiol-disulfide oxidoreductase DCC family protein n=1 Tax=Paenibacillus sedimenti TaxID=2770274 RepID=A0A926QL80_9BACL|nr:thiol-disulfide oxidoreductase DCC family protein [Paenibacillus sedimenti]MBD0383320.1 thiol-disulfide oxidoreductase DCC family protein [Paenibacillus sedimenti]
MDDRHPHQPDEGAIVLFDGVCNLCNGAVQFILHRDPQGVFRFASLQSEVGQKLLRQHLLPADVINTIVLIEHGRSYTQSTAALRIARRLRGAWKAAYAAILIPAPWRNAAYRFVARNRYRWFGQAEHCILPRPEFKQRFLE